MLASFKRRTWKKTNWELSEIGITVDENTKIQMLTTLLDSQVNVVNFTTYSDMLLTRNRESFYLFVTIDLREINDIIEITSIIDLFIKNYEYIDALIFNSSNEENLTGDIESHIVPLIESNHICCIGFDNLKLAQRYIDNFSFLTVNYLVYDKFENDENFDLLLYIDDLNDRPSKISFLNNLNLVLISSSSLEENTNYIPNIKKGKLIN